MEMAREFGATDTVTPGGNVKDVMAMTNGVGVDYAFEVIGLHTIEQCVRARAAARRSWWRGAHGRAFLY